MLRGQGFAFIDLQGVEPITGSDLMLITEANVWNCKGIMIIPWYDMVDFELRISWKSTYM